MFFSLLLFLFSMLMLFLPSPSPRQLGTTLMQSLHPSLNTPLPPTSSSFILLLPSSSSLCLLSSSYNFLPISIVFLPIPWSNYLAIQKYSFIIHSFHHSLLRQLLWPLHLSLLLSLVYLQSLLFFLPKFSSGGMTPSSFSGIRTLESAPSLQYASNILPNFRGL